MKKIPGKRPRRHPRGVSTVPKPPARRRPRSHRSGRRRRSRSCRWPIPSGFDSSGCPRLKRIPGSIHGDTVGLGSRAPKRRPAVAGIAAAVVAAKASAARDRRDHTGGGYLPDSVVVGVGDEKDSRKHPRRHHRDCSPRRNRRSTVAGEADVPAVKGIPLPATVVMMPWPTPCGPDCCKCPR